MSRNDTETQGETATGFAESIFAAVREAVTTIGLQRLRRGPFFGLGSRAPAPEDQA